MALSPEMLELHAIASRLDRTVKKDHFLEAMHVEETISGILRAIKRQPEFIEVAKEIGLNPQRLPINEPWTVSFPMRGDVVYTVNYDEVQRPTDHYHVRRVILDRSEGGITDTGTFCTIPAGSGEKPHIWPRAEVTVGGGEPLEGVIGLAAITNTFPELGLVWH